MPKKRKKDLPQSMRIYRYCVELRYLRDGSTRDLPLRAVRKIHLQKRKGDRQEPDRQLLRLQDDSVLLKGRDIDDMRPSNAKGIPMKPTSAFCTGNATTNPNSAKQKP